VSIEEGVQKRVLLALLNMELVICSHTHNYNRLCKESYKCLTERKRKKIKSYKWKIYSFHKYITTTVQL